MLRRHTAFVVTPKAEAASSDALPAFRAGVLWAGFYAVLLIAGALTSRGWWLWPQLSILLCLLPLTLWATGRTRPRGAA